jgi:hypothetical protein
MLRISDEISTTNLNWTYCRFATELFVSVTGEVTKVTISNQIILVAGDIEDLHSRATLLNDSRNSFVLKVRYTRHYSSYE